MKFKIMEDKIENTEENKKHSHIKVIDFVVSKGINPPDRGRPLASLNFHQLCALLEEYKNS